jgi:CBS domain-containing protein
MKVREMMTVEVTTIEPCDTVETAEKRMDELRVRHLPVADGDVLVGIVSQRDVLAASLPSITHPDPEEDHDLKRRTRVEKIMRGLVETVTLDTDVIEAAEKLLLYKIGCLPVVDDRLHVIGMVTEADFVRLAHDLLLRQLALDERQGA